MRAPTRMIERVRSSLADCLSLPNMIGMGPTITTAPPLVFPVPVLTRETRTTNTAMRTPATMRIVPRVAKLREGKSDSSHSRLVARSSS
jgi:hypothetical protein